MENKEIMDNDEYNPEPVMYYNYEGKSHLKLELNKDISSYNEINIFAYTVNVRGIAPFKQVILSKSGINNNLTFPKVPIFKNLETIELIEYTKFCLYGFLMFENYEIYNELVIFDGFYEYNKNLYLFFDITKCEIELYDIYKNSNLWFCLIDEIVNHKNICNIKICHTVTEIFNYESDLCFLADENDNYYDIPIVGFVSKPEKKLNYTYIFGEIKGDKNNILGPYYYFKDFYNAFKEGNDNSTEFIKMGIVRFAIFVGNVKYIENYPNDQIDESETKKLRLLDQSLDQCLERLTIRITDHDGKWADKYNSVYLGNVELDDGNFLNKRIIVVKEYQQQVPLSFHYINDKTTHYSKDDYSIL
jgi:hypothetical protein